MSFTATGISAERNGSLVSIRVKIVDDDTGDETQATFTAPTVNECVQKLQADLDARVLAKGDTFLKTAIEGHVLARSPQAQERER